MLRSKHLTLTLCLAGLAGGAGVGLWQRPAPRTEAAVSSAASMESRNATAANGPNIPAATPSALSFADRVAAELNGPAPSRLRLEALFMQWFETGEDLWPVFQGLEKQYPQQRGMVTSSFFAAWAWKDCKAAWDKIGGSSLTNREAGIVSVWRVACIRENDAAMEMGSQVFTKDWSVLQRVAQRNPDFATRMLSTLRDASSSQYRAPDATLAIARGWASADPRAALEWAGALKNNGEEVMRVVCAAWHKQDPGALKNLTGPLRERLEKDAVFAILTGGTVPSSPSKSPHAGAGTEALTAALLNPFATLGDVFGLMKLAADDQSTGRYLLSAGDPWAWTASDPRGTLESLLMVPLGRDLDRTITPLLNAWAGSDRDAATAFAETHGIKSWKPAMTDADAAKIYEGLTLPEAERRFLHSGEGQPDFNGLSSAVMAKVRKDPAAAVEFLTSNMDKLVNGEGHWRMVLGNAAMIWSSVDLSAATGWAAALPEGPVREQAIGSIIQELSEYDAAAALTWAATLQQPGWASRDLKGIAGDLQRQLGPEGARLAIRQSAMTEERKQEMLKTIR